MLARYYSSGLARFLAVDPGDDTEFEDPQSWNKYAYVRNNPLRANDPTGEAEVIVNDPKQRQQFEHQLQDTAGPGITLEDNTIKFDDTQLGSGVPYSETARQGLKDVASPDTKGTLILDKSADPALAQSGEGITKGPAPGGADGGDIVAVQVSGRDAGDLQDAFGLPVPGPSSVVLAHEIVGHGLPGLQGMSGGNAVATENAIRRELGLPERKPEPGH